MSKEQDSKKEQKAEPKKYQRPTLTKYAALKKIMGDLVVSTAETPTAESA
ncbi:MAG: hypothetical protein ISS47_09980 [Candidatus Omnitrophica bacterium]|nr:hypothetical protein [Candidatus Omnitrophota bacterium]